MSIKLSHLPIGFSASKKTNEKKTIAGKPPPGRAMQLSRFGQNRIPIWIWHSQIEETSLLNLLLIRDGGLDEPRSDIFSVLILGVHILVPNFKDTLHVFLLFFVYFLSH